jgi:hypothetical protein
MQRIARSAREAPGRTLGYAGRMLRPALAIALTCVSCRSPTQITVIVTTDVDCTKVTGTAIATGQLDVLTDKPAASTTSHCDTATGAIGTLIVVPSGAKDEEVALRIVSGVGKDAEACSSAADEACIVAKRAVRFIPHSELIMRVVMRASCLGKACAKDETCVRGDCVKATILDPAVCSGSGCDESTLLPSPDSGVSDSFVPGAGWTPIALPPARLSARVGHTAIWTGSEMIVWGGNADTIYYADGASYDPSTNTWTMLPDAGSLSARSNHTAVWTGSAMIVWGGDDGSPVSDHASYDPKTHTWTTLPAAPISDRTRHVAAYATTTNEMLVWGGTGALPDGAALRLTPTPTWRKLEPSPLPGREQPGAAWDGTRMVIFGGADATGTPLADAGTYHPAAKSWSKLPPPPAAIDGRIPFVALAIPPVSASQTVAFFGGYGLGSPRNNGVSWNGSAWTLLTPTASAFPSAGRLDPIGFASPGRLWLWGGSVSGKYLDTGASCDLASGAWSAMPAGPPSARGGARAIWTGTAAIVWGGESGKPLRDGAIFRP